jgi:NAD(P)-dependent dehydrogenase (short-subunit alcohol dehydrogenase family)
MQNVLIIGGNRGIGLELCRQYSQRGDKVTTTCRQSAGKLSDIAVDVLTDIDVSLPSGAALLKEKLGDSQVDILIHSAGILTNESLEDMNFERIEHQFAVNTLGPLRVIHALQDNLGAGSKIGIISSRMGSIADNGSGGRYGYRISKAGANAVGVSLARDLEEREIAVAILHPGLVATEMTGGNGIDPVDAAKGIVERIDVTSLKNSGTFWHAEGYELPW